MFLILLKGGALAEVGRSDPHGACTAFTFGVVHKWAYFQRTIPECSEQYEPLEKAVRELLIPSLTGLKSYSDLERALFALPCRLGGLGIPDPSKTAAGAFNDSISFTEPLVRKIIDKEMVIDHSTKQAMEFKNRHAYWRMKI